MSKNLIFTISSGTVHGIFSKLSVPLMEKYAIRCSADFKYEERELKYPLFGKFDVKNMLDKYDRVLYLDCDILVRPDSPNIFDIVPQECFAAFNEGSWCKNSEIDVRSNLIAIASKLIGIDPKGFSMYTNYFNGGVFLANQNHRHLFSLDYEGPELEQNTVEQNMINLRLFANKDKIYSLPICFNAMPWRWPVEYVAESYFIHYAGVEPSKRFEMMKSDYEKVCSYDK